VSAIGIAIPIADTLVLIADNAVFKETAKNKKSPHVKAVRGFFI